MYIYTFLYGLLSFRILQLNIDIIFLVLYDVPGLPSAKFKVTLKCI